MAAKEKGKIVSASPDSPTLEKLSTFSQQIRSALHCFSAVATRTNALWQRTSCAETSQLCTVATRTNALWQSTQLLAKINVMQVATRTNALWQRSERPVSIGTYPVATRTNALWQSRALRWQWQSNGVATRTNALWQRSTTAIGCEVQQSQPARMRCGKVAPLSCRTL